MLNAGHGPSALSEDSMTAIPTVPFGPVEFHMPLSQLSVRGFFAHCN